MKCPICGEREVTYSHKRCRACYVAHRPTAVRRAITASGLTIGEIARRAGVSCATVLRAARGVALGRSSARALAAQLGVDASVILMGEAANGAPPAQPDDVDARAIDHAARAGGSRR